MTTTAQVAAACVEWGKMVKTQNAKGLTEVYTEDCRPCPQGYKPFIGRADFQKYVQERMDAGWKDAELITDEIDPLADSIGEGGYFWERGHYVFNGEGGVVLDTGEYVAIWRKESGKILCHVDYWHTNRK